MTVFLDEKPYSISYFRRMMETAKPLASQPLSHLLSLFIWQMEINIYVQGQANRHFLN